MLTTSARIFGCYFVPFPGTQLCRIQPPGQGAAEFQLPTALPKPGDKKSQLGSTAEEILLLGVLPAVPPGLTAIAAGIKKQKHLGEQ